MSLNLEHIGVRAGGRMVLSDFCLQLEEGEWMAVVGANGSGRSTLAQVAAGLLKPRRGCVTFNGIDIWSRDGKPARARLGLVMQRAEDQFLGETVYDDLAFGLRQRRVAEPEVERSVEETLGLVGFDLQEVRGRSPLGFSGGQRRRLAIAAILVLQPKVLILDEPFAGLDCQARLDMVQLLEVLHRRGEMTILSLTTDLDFVMQANRLALLIDGKILLVGHMPDFVANRTLCREAGIMLPEVIRLALGLRERGWTVPILGSVGALESAIASQWGQRKHA